MLPSLHELTIQFFDSGGGDAIWIRFLGNDQHWHNILIDGGYRGSYNEIFKPVIVSIKEAGENIDLWVITHIDLDHIGAILAFIDDDKIADKSILIKNYWFNHAVFMLSTPTNKIGFKQGIDLRTYLENINKLTIGKITNESGERDLFGLKLTLLSPTPDKIELADQDWIEKEKKQRGKMGRSVGDHDKKIEELAGNLFMEDTDPTNGSSIAFLMSFKNIKGLFLADGHPSDIVSSLRKLKFTETCPLLLSFVKLSHHGSKGNTSPELLSLIRTPVYAITGYTADIDHLILAECDQ